MALRLLHTSDWHLGHALYGFDRTPEHAAVLAWLLDRIEEERVDALLLAGDVFDAANPPTEAVALWHRFLVEAWRRFPWLQVVVVGGNHDSASRLDATEPFLSALERLHVMGGVPRAGGEPDLSRLVVPLRDRAGQVAAWVAAVPFLRAGETGAGTEEEIAAATRRFYDGVLAEARSRRSPGQALLAMGHLYLTGAQVSELSERRLWSGNQSAVGADLFPDDVAYAALGHLHLAQPVGGRDHVRYSGSLLPLALDERRYRHQVVIVELDGEALSGWRALEAPRPVPILRIPEQGAAPLGEVVAAVKALPARGPGAGPRPLLDVCVALEQPEPALRERLEELLEGKAARLARLKTGTPGTGRALGDVEARALAELSPEEVFLRKHEKDFGRAPEPELASLFRRLLEEVEGAA
ncbi:MAG: exonuclease SbcCD subunit D C-terminal domain-containing protein [Anaeromyxobacter sp.]